MNKTQKRATIIFFTVCVLWIAVIFSFSLRSGASSHSESGFVERLLSEAAHRLNLSIDHRFYVIFSPFADNKPVTSETVVRKTAHFTEYFVFGLFCAQTALLLKRRRFCLAPLPLLLGPAVSLFDERVIQLFLVVGRTSSYMDVLLDSIGFYCAIAISIAAARILARMRKKRQPSGML